MRLRLLAAAALTAALVTSCGSPTSDDGAESSDGKTGYEKVLPAIEAKTDSKQRLDELARMAEAEGGQLNLYTSLTSDVVDAVTGEFSDAYDIDVNVYRADSETVLKRLAEESRANFRGADVVETNGPELYNLGRENVLVEYQPSSLADLVEGSDFDGWTATRYNKFVISHNTNLVADGEGPKTWEELADPKWDGKVALELGDVEWYKTLYEYFVQQGKSEDEAQKIFEDTARGAQIVKGHTVLGELMAAGDVAVAASNYSYLVQRLKDGGAPIAWEPPVEPVVSRPNGVALVREARHPATAVLFVEWLLGDGQEVLAKEKLDVARKDLATAKGADEIRVDLDSFVEAQEEWTDRYEKLTQLGAEAK